MIYLLIKTGHLIITSGEIIMNKEEDLTDFKHDKKPRKELFIREPQTYFGNMRKIHILALGSGLDCARALSTLSLANVVVHSMSFKSIEKEGDFLALNKPDWTEISKRFAVSVNTTYISEETLVQRSDFDFQKQSKRNRFREDVKSQKFKAKHRLRT